MNAIHLHLPNGDPTGWTMCAECGMVAAPGNKDVSEKCCTCYDCGNPLPKEERTRWAEGKSYSLYHNACQKARRAKHDAETLEKAELVPDYDGPVYFEGLRGSYGDGYFSDVHELAETLNDQEEPFTRPAFAFCCEQVKPRRIDSGDIVEMICDEMDDDASERIEGLGELDTALREFYAANGGLISWYEDRRRKVAIPTRDNATAKVAAGTAMSK